MVPKLYLHRDVSGSKIWISTLEAELFPASIEIKILCYIVKKLVLVIMINCKSICVSVSDTNIV